jgi:hypothetical protein
LSPHKKQHVLSALYKRNRESICDSPSRTAPHNKTTPECADAVVTFFESEDISWYSPNARDYVRIRGTNQRKMRAYLTCSLKEVFAMFQERHPQMRIGYTRFCSLRPMHICINRLLPAINGEGLMSM